MSGDGARKKRKEEDDFQKQEQTDEEEAAQQPRPTRPYTARGSRRRRTPSSSLESLGAVGGESHDAGGSHSRHLTEQQKKVGGQAHMLLEMFIMDRMWKDRLSSQQRGIVHNAINQENEQQKQKPAAANEDYLDDITESLKAIGDQLSEDYDLNRLIDLVPIQSPREIFMKVCKQMFQDGQFNWGRVVALFYFAYRLIVKAVVFTMDKGIPWIKEILTWAMDFFIQYVAWWIIQRGGWNMIREYWGSSQRTMVALAVTAVVCLSFVWWKQQ